MVVGGEGESLSLFPSFNTLIPNTVESVIVGMGWGTESADVNMVEAWLVALKSQ